MTTPEDLEDARKRYQSDLDVTTAEITRLTQHMLRLQGALAAVTAFLTPSATSDPPA